MPIYGYRCEECDREFDRNLRIAQCSDPQECPDCGHSPAKKLISAVGFVLKGNDFPGKNHKIKRQMQKKNQRLDSKQNQYKRDGGGVRLAPNVGGERVDSWSEATKLARSQGKETSGYEKLARKEKKGDV